MKCPTVFLGPLNLRSPWIEPLKNEMFGGDHWLVGFCSIIGDTFCGLTFKIGGRFKRIHSFQHSIFVTKAHDDNASHFAMTKQVMLWYLYSLKIKYGVGTNTSSRLYFIATKGRCNFFPCTIQYFYFHSNSISTTDFIYDIFSLSRLSLV